MHDIENVILVINAGVEIKHILSALADMATFIFEPTLDHARKMDLDHARLQGIIINLETTDHWKDLVESWSHHTRIALCGAVPKQVKDIDTKNLVLIKNITNEGYILREFIEGRSKTPSDYQSEHKFIGQSEAIEHIRWLVNKVARLDSTVLLTGETGTGKEVVARMIHDQSPAREQHFVAVNSAGIPETLLESTLFGYEKGAFTGAIKNQKGYFEIADKGTIFLDEIGETSPAMQVKVLRVLQEHKFTRVGDVMPIKTSARIIAATNRDLAKLVKENNFREDLYYRLNVIVLRLPPLRERTEDIPLLAKHFMKRFTRKHNRLGVYLKPETLSVFQQYSWPGNVREMENIIDRLVALSESDWIGPDELPEELLEPTIEIMSPSRNDRIIPFSDAKCNFEKNYILRLLQKTNGNVSQAARLAQMPRQNLHVKIKKYNLKNIKETISEDND